MNTHLINLLDFSKKYPNQWHTYAKDQITVNTVKKAEELNLIEVNEYGQFKAKENT